MWRLNRIFRKRLKETSVFFFSLVLVKNRFSKNVVQEKKSKFENFLPTSCFLSHVCHCRPNSRDTMLLNPVLEQTPGAVWVDKTTDVVLAEEPGGREKGIFF